MEILQMVEPYVTYGYEDHCLLLLFARNNTFQILTWGNVSLISDILFSTNPVILLEAIIAEDDGMIQINNNYTFVNHMLTLHLRSCVMWNPYGVK